MSKLTLTGADRHMNVCFNNIWHLNGVEM